MKVLIVTRYFPPSGGGGVQRPLKLATHLPALGIETHVLAPDDPKWITRDEDLLPPSQAFVHRARYLGPRARMPSDELHARRGLDRALRKAGLFSRRLLVPDPHVTWSLTAVPAALRIVRDEEIDVVLTTSPPGSVHLIGAAVKARTGARWVADLRDPLIADPDRAAAGLPGRLKERSQHPVARLVARSADATVAIADYIADEIRAFSPAGPVAVIPNGCDFDDFAGLEYRRADRFRITYTGSFFAQRDPRPFLQAIAHADDLDVVARFVGRLRPADQEWAESLGLGERLELLPYVPRRRALELQRDSDALLLLVADAGGRGRAAPSGKIFDYLAAGRPILAAVPPDGAAADLVRETHTGLVVPPDDVDALREAITDLYARWRSGELDGQFALSPALRDRLSRRKRAEELAELLWSLE
ncbi:MAG TPA: glycosyltransferase family 4 protein [Gaiellaceae bacterium]|jgi:glycosyltransferase involved in cell wall biosynthesis|nr:glycosyltransferase family 4 protein [Gaiellaceae bacterium]